MDRLLSKVRHALGVFRVYRRPLVRFLDYFHLIRVGTRLRVTLRNGLTVTVRTGTSDFGVIDDIFISGVYDKTLNRLREGQKVIDIGAQCGIFALAAAARGATVLCVEPLPENYELLVENARLNGYETRIACQNVAVCGYGSDETVCGRREYGRFNILPVHASSMDEKPQVDYYRSAMRDPSRCPRLPRGSGVRLPEDGLRGS